MAYKFKKSNCETSIDVDVCKCCEDKEKENLFLAYQDALIAYPTNYKNITCFYKAIITNYKSCEELIGARSVFAHLETTTNPNESILNNFLNRYGATYDFSDCIQN